MNRLVWKLLRQHISVGQLTGFFLANLFGMMIVLLSIQFYQDVLPFFHTGRQLYEKRIYHRYQKNQYPRQPYRKKQHFLPKRY